MVQCLVPCEKACIFTVNHIKMKRSYQVLLATCLMLLAFSADAQVVYVTEWKSEADKIVYVSEYESEADVVVYRTEWRTDAQPKSGIWYFTEWRNDANLVIYFTEWRSEADLVIAYTEWKSDAMWRNK